MANYKSIIAAAAVALMPMAFSAPNAKAFNHQDVERLRDMSRKISTALHDIHNTIGSVDTSSWNNFFAGECLSQLSDAMHLVGDSVLRLWGFGELSVEMVNAHDQQMVNSYINHDLTIALNDIPDARMYINRIADPGRCGKFPIIVTRAQSLLDVLTNVDDSLHAIQRPGAVGRAGRRKREGTRLKAPVEPAGQSQEPEIEPEQQAPTKP